MRSTHILLFVSLCLALACSEDPADGSSPGDTGELPPLPAGATPDLDRATEALNNCDVRTAQGRYDATWRLNENSGPAAFGFGLTDMTLLGEDPNAVAGLKLFGFTSGISPEMILTGPGAFLDSVRRNIRSSDFSDYIQANFPYPAVRDGYTSSEEVLKMIPPGKTAKQVVDSGLALQDRFSRLSVAFEVAANSGPHTIRIDGICGVGTVQFSKATLYWLSASWQAAVLGLQIARGYDWNFPLIDGIDFSGNAARLKEQVEVLNRHLGSVSNKDALGKVPGHWRRFFDLVEAGLNAMQDGSVPSSDALIDWRAFRAGLVPSMLEQVRAARDLADGPVTAPGLTPTFTGNLSPLSRGSLDLPMYERSFSVHEDAMWNDAWIEVDEAPVEQILLQVLNRTPLNVNRDLEWKHTDAWRGSDAEWQITDVPSSLKGYPTEVPRFVSNAVSRYQDQWYFE